MNKVSWLLLALLLLSWSSFVWFYQWASNQSSMGFHLGFVAGQSAYVPSIAWSLENKDLAPLHNIVCDSEDRHQTNLEGYDDSIYIGAAKMTIVAAIDASHRYKTSNGITDCLESPSTPKRNASE